MNCTDSQIANKHMYTATCAVINSPFSPSPLLTPCFTQDVTIASNELFITTAAISSTFAETAVTIDPSTLSPSVTAVTTDPSTSSPHVTIDLASTSSPSVTAVTTDPSTSSPHVTIDLASTSSPSVTVTTCVPSTSSSVVPAVTTVCVLLAIVVTIETSVIVAILCTIHQRKKKHMSGKYNSRLLLCNVCDMYM